MRRISKVLVPLAAALCAAAPADAAPFTFTLTGATTASWQMDSQPQPDESSAGTAFEVDGVSGSFGSGVTSADLTFFDAAYGGGLEIFDPLGGSPLVVADGPQLYSGSADMPSFSTGTFALTDSGGTATYSLLIGDATSAVPEPASWALALIGFGAIGSVARSRRSTLNPA